MKLAEQITRIIDFFYIKPITKLMPRDTFRYAACGGGNLVLNWVLYFLVFHFLVRQQLVDLGIIAISAHIATMLITFPITFFTGFWLQKNVSFSDSPLPTGTKLLRYALTVAGSLVLNYIGLKFFVEWCHIYPTPSQIITSLISVVYSYFAQRYYTFKK